MKILLTGASGFIGDSLARALLAEGHTLVCPVRRMPTGNAMPDATFVPMDFGNAQSEDDWMPLLENVDAVINTVGIFRERQTGDFAAVHVRAPQALFRAAQRQNVRCVIQFSALGSDENAASDFHLSKRAADDALRMTNMPAAIVQPSLVYGPGGASASLFKRLAVLPAVPLPGGGRQAVQPVHLDDVVDGVLALLRTPPQTPLTIAFCGAAPITVRNYLAALRRALDVDSRQRVIPLPMRLATSLAAAASMLPGSLIDPTALSMLERGNTADPAPFAALIGRPPRPPGRFIAPQTRDGQRASALLDTTLPLLRFSIALVWLWTAAVSFGLYPVADSLDLLHRTGVPTFLAPVALYGAATLDLAFGILTLLLRGRARQWLWVAQAVLIAGYTAIITVRLPEFWIHPFGPLSKNLPMLAALVLLYLHEPVTTRKREWNT
ncbi:SDR family oxidoreductase [Achromobacter spanius]|uniref:SDR family oxidoreductase n=1 Tax=Achromobacter spanius TaxID=217203 RepID=UPI00381C4CFA